MKVLLSNGEDSKRYVMAIAQAFAGDSIPVSDGLSPETSTACYVKSVLVMYTVLGETVYVIMPQSEVETILSRLFDIGDVDLTSYVNETFVEPDENDVPRINQVVESLRRHTV